VLPTLCGQKMLWKKYEDDPNIYIQFSDMEKVGMNPMTHEDYNTPDGIYTYPLKALLENFAN
jgi:hypothetical protein